MKLTIGWDGTDETLTFAQQLGVTHLKVNSGDYLDESRKGPILREKLLAAKKRIETHDLKIGVALLPQEVGSQHWNIRLGRPEREKEMTTAIGHGAAIPHGRIDSGPGIQGVLGISRKGIEFGAHDDVTVKLMLLIVTAKEQEAKHIEVLCRIGTSD